MIKISKHNLSESSKPRIIAEIGQSHLGEIKNIKKIINLVSQTGADFIKFQTHYAEAESTLDEPFRVKNYNFNSRFDYWKSVEFNIKEWKKIKDICTKNNITFLSSPFSLKAVYILKKIGVSAWKIGSGEFFSDDMLEQILKYKQPIILSTGLANTKELTEKVKKLKNKKAKLILMQCTSLYPCPINQINPMLIKIFKKKFNCLTGLSDHSGSIYPSIFALSNGASLIEVHVEEKKSKLNPDSTSSISIEELRELCKARDQIYQMKISKNKKKLTSKLLITKKIFTKSCALKRDKDKGYIIKKDDITFKKPGFGINPKYINKIIGKQLIRNVSSNKILKKTDYK